MPRQQHTYTSRGLDKLDQRTGRDTSAGHSPTRGPQPPRWSSSSRPGQTAYGCRGSSTHTRHEVSTSSTNVGERHARHEVSTSSTNERGATHPPATRRPAGRNHPAGRACRDPARQPTNAAAAAHIHVTRSRQARPTNGARHIRRPLADPRAATTPLVELVETRRDSLRMPRQQHTYTSRGLDKLDQRRGATRTHVTGSRQARPTNGARHIRRPLADPRAATTPLVELVETRRDSLRMPRQQHTYLSRGLDAPIDVKRRFVLMRGVVERR